MTKKFDFDAQKLEKYIKCMKCKFDLQVWYSCILLIFATFLESIQTFLYCKPLKLFTYNNKTNLYYRFSQYETFVSNVWGNLARNLNLTLSKSDLLAFDKFCSFWASKSNFFDMQTIKIIYFKNKINLLLQNEPFIANLLKMWHETWIWPP